MSKVELEIDIMYCKHCGKEITDDSRFCNYCGKVQGETNQIVSFANNNKKEPFKINKTAIADAIVVIAKELGIWLLIVAFVMLVASFIIIVFRDGNSGSDGVTVITISIIVLIVGRYVIKLIRWVNKHKSK